MSGQRYDFSGIARQVYGRDTFESAWNSIQADVQLVNDVASQRYWDNKKDLWTLRLPAFYGLLATTCGYTNKRLAENNRIISKKPFPIDDPLRQLCYFINNTLDNFGTGPVTLSRLEVLLNLEEFISKIGITYKTELSQDYQANYSEILHSLFRLNLSKNAALEYAPLAVYQATKRLLDFLKENSPYYELFKFGAEFAADLDLFEKAQNINLEEESLHRYLRARPSDEGELRNAIRRCIRETLLILGFFKLSALPASETYWDEDLRNRFKFELTRYFETLDQCFTLLRRQSPPRLLAALENYERGFILSMVEDRAVERRGGTLEPQSSRTYNRSRLSTLVSLKPFSSAKKVELGIPFRLSAEILLLRNGQFFSEKSWSVPNFSQALGKLEFSGQDSSFLIKLSEAMRASNAAVSSVEVESVGDQVFHFSFSRCDLSHEDGQDALVAVVSTFAHLKSLKLYGLGLTDQALEKLMRVLPRSLQKLVLNENVIGFRGIHILANALTSLPNLLELHLRENPIGKGDAANVSVSIHALADAISLHPALRCLQINGCDITDANALRYLIAHLGKVSWLDASRNVCGNALKGTAEEPSLGQLINRSNIREYLALAACGMNFNTIESLISELESNDKVQRLVLDGNGFIRGHSARLEDQRHVSLTQRIEAIEQRNQGNAYFSDAVRAFMPEALPVLPSEAAIAAAAEVKASGVEGPKVSPFSGAVAFASSACEFTQDSKRVESSSEEKSSLQDIFNEIDAEERRRNGRDFADNLLQRFQEDAPKKHSLNPELPGVSAQKVEENRSQLIALKDQIVARLSDQPSFNQVYCHMRERSLLWVGIRRLFQLGTGESLARQKHVFSERSVWEDTIIQPLLNLIARQADAMPRMNFPVGLAQSNSVHMAVHVGNLESLKTLLSDPIYEAGLNIPNANGLTPIQVAVTQDRLDILKVLEPKTSLMGASPEGFELLHLCAQFGSFECYQYLRAKPGFLPESRNNKYGANVFQVASAYAQMNFLLKVYELEFSTRDSRTFKDFIQEHYLLHVVGALSSNPDLLWEPIALLIDKGADINQQAASEGYFFGKHQTPAHSLVRTAQRQRFPSHYLEIWLSRYWEGGAVLLADGNDRTALDLLVEGYCDLTQLKLLTDQRHALAQANELIRATCCEFFDKKIIEKSVAYRHFLRQVESCIRYHTSFMTGLLKACLGGDARDLGAWVARIKLIRECLPKSVPKDGKLPHKDREEIQRRLNSISPAPSSEALTPKGGSSPAAGGEAAISAEQVALEVPMKAPTALPLTRNQDLFVRTLRTLLENSIHYCRCLTQESLQAEQSARLQAINMASYGLDVSITHGVTAGGIVRAAVGLVTLLQHQFDKARAERVILFARAYSPDFSYLHEMCDRIATHLAEKYSNPIENLGQKAIGGTPIHDLAVCAATRIMAYVGNSSSHLIASAPGVLRNAVRVTRNFWGNKMIAPLPTKYKPLEQIAEEGVLNASQNTKGNSAVEEELRTGLPVRLMDQATAIPVSYFFDHCALRVLSDMGEVIYVSAHEKSRVLHPVVGTARGSLLEAEKRGYVLQKKDPAAGYATARASQLPTVAEEARAQPEMV